MRQVHLTASLDNVAIHADCPLFGSIHRQGDWYKNLTFICSGHLLNAKTGKKIRWSAYAANRDYARRAVLLPLSHTRRLSDRTPVNASVAHSGRSSICILFSRLNQPSCTQPCVTFFHVCKSGTIDYKAVWDLSEGRLSSNVCCERVCGRDKSGRRVVVGAPLAVGCLDGCEVGGGAPWESSR